MLPALNSRDGIDSRLDDKRIESLARLKELIPPNRIAIVEERSRIVDDYKIKTYPTTVFIGLGGRIELYEVGAILNADMIFNKRMKLNKNRNKSQKEKSSKN